MSFISIDLFPPFCKLVTPFEHYFVVVYPLFKHCAWSCVYAYQIILVAPLQNKRMCMWPFAFSSNILNKVMNSFTSKLSIWVRYGTNLKQYVCLWSMFCLAVVWWQRTCSVLTEGVCFVCSAVGIWRLNHWLVINMTGLCWRKRLMISLSLSFLAFLLQAAQLMWKCWSSYSCFPCMLSMLCLWPLHWLVLSMKFFPKM